MTEFLLIRHAVNDFVKTGKLAGWTPEVHLNEEGRAQAVALGVRLAKTKIDVIYSSPLERTVETAQAILEHHPELKLQMLEEVGEVRYGDWQGAELSKLSQRKLWPIVQTFPSRVRFPNGETMREAQMRAVNALETLTEKHPRARVAVVSHSDVIKMIVAHYLGMHLDMFQRINISPASLTVLSLGYGRITIGQINEASYLPMPKKGDVTEIKSVQTITLDTVGEPGHRVFYLQAVHGEHEIKSVVLEKTQAMLIADEVDKLFEQLSQNYPQLVPVQAGTAPILHDPEPAMIRAGKIALQYDEKTELISFEIGELLGVDQGVPQVLRLWVDRQQIITLGQQARQVVQRGRPE